MFEVEAGADEKQQIKFVWPNVLFLFVFYTNAGISELGTLSRILNTTIMLYLISNRMSVKHRYNSAIDVRTARSKKSEFTGAYAGRFQGFPETPLTVRVCHFMF